MKLLKYVFLFLPVFCQAHASSCDLGSINELASTWKLFRKASLTGSPKEISRFYKFPLTVVSPADEALTFKINKNKFLDKYNSLFKEIAPNEETELFLELKASTESDFKNASQQFQVDGCSRSGHAEIDSYKFLWSKERGWHVSEVSPPGYSIMRQEAK